MADLKQFAEQLVNLTVKEVNDLATILKDEYGIEPAAAAVVVAAGGAAEAADEGKAIYAVHIMDAGAQKIAVIKVVREIRPDLGLKQAKDLVDAAPKEVKGNVPAEEAEEMKKKLEGAGAKVELK